MNRAEIVDLLELVSSAYPNTKIKDAENTVRAWELAFGEYPAEQIYKATRLHMNTNRFFPTPADISDLIVRAEIVYNGSNLLSNRLEAKSNGITPIYSEDELEAKLEAFCEWIGFGYPNEIED